MTKLQNNFLKLYEELNQLWEADDTPIADIAGSKDSPTSNREYDFSFSTIVQKALAIQAGEEKFDVAYWCRLREILFNKHIRLGDIVAHTWYGRFLSFYKTYRVECALRAWFDEYVPELKGVQFTASEAHHRIWEKEDRSAEPDFKTGAGYFIECKEYTSDSSVHGADLVIRHAPAQQKMIYFCLVGEEETLQNIFTKGLPKYVYCLDQTRTLNDGFSKFPLSRADMPQLDMDNNEVNQGLPSVKKVEAALKAVDKLLENDLNAVEQKAALILDSHTKQLSKVVEISADEGEVKKPTPPNLPSGDLATAVANLTDAAKDLEKVAISINKDTNI